MFSSIKESADLSPFAWIEEALRSPVGCPPEGDTALRLVDIVPPGFEAYAKIFHPIYENPDLAGQSITWDEADRASATEEDHPIARMIRESTTALRTGVDGEAPPHWRRVLWSELTDQFGLPYGPELTGLQLDRSWPGGSWPARLVGPDEGDLTSAGLGALVQAIREGGEPGRCYFWWWIVACMRVLKPERDYLFEGSLKDLPRFVAHRKLSSPNYWWPADLAWCVATSWDLCFTIIGGSKDLIARVLASPEIEALEVAPADALLRYPPKR